MGYYSVIPFKGHYAVYDNRLQYVATQKQTKAACYAWISCH